MLRRERERQADHRRDRHRVPSRRGLDALGEPGAAGLTVRELDALGPLLDDRHVAQEVIEKAGIECTGDLVEQVVAAMAPQDGHVLAEAAWFAAINLAGWSRADWSEQQPTAARTRPRDVRLVLTEAGLRRLAWTRLLALRGALALRAGYGRAPLRTIEAWWISTARAWLADHEIGAVLEAARLSVVAAATRGALAEALDSVWPKSVLDADALARVAVERWRRLRNTGWGEISRRKAA